MQTSFVEQRFVLACPFPAEKHPQADVVHKRTIEWAKQQGLVNTARDLRRLEAGNYTELMARAYPRATGSTLQTIADFNTWGFVLDDQFDEQLVGRNPDAVETIHGRILAIIRGELPTSSDSVLIHALHDVVRRLQAQRDREWMHRFHGNIRDTMAAGLWEARNRQTQIVPSEAEYRYWRVFTSALYCYLPLIEVAEQISLPSFVIDHPHFQRLIQSANYIISWANDLFSVTKERQRGELHNLVLIVQHERQMSFADASAYVAGMHDQEIANFQHLCATVPRFGGNLDKYVDKYVTSLQGWIRANMDWSLATQRYQFMTQHARME